MKDKTPLIRYCCQFGLSIQKNGEQLIVTPKSKLTEELRELIQKNKAEILKELSFSSAYWLIGQLTLISPSPPLTLFEVQVMYPNQLIEPLTDLPRSRNSEPYNSLRVDQLRQRINNLEGVFYDQEDTVFAIRWLEKGIDIGDLESLISDAEKQISLNKKPQTT